MAHPPVHQHPTTTLKSLGEGSLIRLLREVAEISGCRLSPDLGVDDTAVTSGNLTLPGGALVWTTDSMQEGTHFRFWKALERIPCSWLGRKLAMTNLSDVAAKGGKPKYALLTMGLPPESSITRIREFLGGLLTTLAEHDVELLGGDTYGAASWNLGLTLVGEVSEGSRVPVRNKGVAGDTVYASGELGASARGLHFLELWQVNPPNQFESWELLPPVVQRHLSPPDRGELGRALVEIHPRLAMMDLSDGILEDAFRLAVASNCGLELRWDRLPFAKSLLGSGLNPEQATELALTGGEDYELLFTSPLPEDELAQHLSRLGITVPCTAIGQLTATPGMHIMTLDGRTILPESFATYRHF